MFGERRYQPGTTSGRWLLAHELTHTIQQSGVNGRSNAQRMMQRATCEHDAPPRDMECTAAESSPPTTPVETIPFAVNDPQPGPDGAARIERFLEHWHHSGAMDLVQVDGFASCVAAPAPTGDFPAPALGLSPASSKRLGRAFSPCPTPCSRSSPMASRTSSRQAAVAKSCGDDRYPSGT